MSAAQSHRSIAAALPGTRALLLDLDGVVVFRGAPIQGAADALARLDAAGIPYAIVTNISLLGRASISRDLAAAGIAIPPERIVSASSAAAGYCRSRFGAEPLYVMGAPDAMTEFAGLTLLSHDEAAAPGAKAAAVVVGDAAEDFVPRNLQAAFTLIREGARFLAMHRNRWWFTAEGARMDSGAYVAALEFATQRRAFLTGKPAHPFYEAGLAILRARPWSGGAAGSAADRSAPGSAAADRSAAASGSGTLLPGDVAMVGDDPWNDLAGASRLGMRTAFVRSGKYGEAELARWTRERGAPPDVDATALLDIAIALTGRG
jgi:HAD superfamily hydrolase (TIGR01450 family)